MFCSFLEGWMFEMYPTASVEGLLRRSKLHLLAGTSCAFILISLREPSFKASFKFITLEYIVMRLPQQKFGVTTEPQAVVNDRFKPTVEMSTATTTHLILRAMPFSISTTLSNTP